MTAQSGKFKGRSRWLWIAASGLILLGCYFLTPMALTGMAGSLVRADPVTKADLIVALGGDPRCLREKRSAELFLQGMASKLIVSGVPSAWGINTGDAAKRYVVSLGVPESSVIALRESFNTRIEAIAVSEIMKSNGWHSAIIVTSPFHSRRAMHTFERYAAGNSFYSMPLPEQKPEWQRERWWSRRGDMGTTIREMIAWGNTLAGGFK
jgi:uncharacterized SAM-binding protein YcdF (DUF218 family)